MKHLSGGDLLRAQISSKTEVGLLAKTFMDKGTLVPDDVISKLSINELKNLKACNWLLDGQYKFTNIIIPTCCHSVNYNLMTELYHVVGSVWE